MASRKKVQAASGKRRRAQVEAGEPYSKKQEEAIKELLGDDCYKDFVELRQMQSAQDESNITWYYVYGRTWNLVCKKYEKGKVAKISKALHVDRTVIYDAKRFAERVTTKAELNTLVKAKMPNGRCMSWGHVRLLINIDDAEKRQATINLVVTHGWNPSELQKHINEKITAGKTNRAGRSGRKFTVPPNIEKGIKLLTKVTEDFARRQTEVLQPSVIAKLAKLPEEEVTATILENLKSTLPRHEEIETNTASFIGTIKAAIKRFERTLESREEAQQAAAAAEAQPEAPASKRRPRPMRNNTAVEAQPAIPTPPSVGTNGHTRRHIPPTGAAPAAKRRRSLPSA